LAEDAINRLERVLREEREAIGRLDGAKVLDCAKEKEALVASLHSANGSLEEPARTRLRALVPALRHNGILLAHARDILRDALSAARAAQRPVAGAPLARASARVLSVRG
jgi:hypothetical protein